MEACQCLDDSERLRQIESVRAEAMAMAQYIRFEYDSTLRAALLRKGRPFRGPFEVGQRIAYYRARISWMARRGLWKDIDKEWWLPLMSPTATFGYVLNENVWCFAAVSNVELFLPMLRKSGGSLDNRISTCLRILRRICRGTC